MGLNFLIWVLNFESKKSYQEIAFSMGRFQKTTCSSAAAQFLIAKCSENVDLDLITLNPAVGKSSRLRTCLKVGFTVRSGRFLIQI